MLTQENPVFSYHSILVWNQWYPQHKLPGTEHVSALVRRRRQQQPPPTPKRPRRGKRKEEISVLESGNSSSKLVRDEMAWTWTN
jgi:hypothetical protein